MKCKECNKELKEGHFESNGNNFCSRNCIVMYESKSPKERIDWDLIEEQKKLNKYPRINWKAILGMSLTRAIARCKAAGLTAEMTYSVICFEKPQLTDEMKRRLKIGIAARFGEIATSQSELKKTKK